MRIILYILFIFILTVNSSFAEVKNYKNINFTSCYENSEQFPYYIGFTDEVFDNKPGVSIEVIKIIGKKLGFNTEFVRAPWKRCLNMIKYSNVDAIFNASFKKERMKLGHYPRNSKNEVDIDRRIADISYHLYSKKDVSKIWTGNYSDLYGLIVGVPLGYSIVSDLKKHNIRIEESVDSPKILKKLVEDRILIAALQDITADKLISLQKNYFKDVKKLFPAIASKPYYIMISHKFYQENLELSEEIWNNIRDIRENKIKDIIQKYM